MKNPTRSDWHFTLSALITFYVLFIPGLFFSQTAEIHQPEWTTETRENGNITVTYSISKQDNYRGEKVTIVEYMSTITANTTLTDCIDLLTEVSRHTEFTDNSTSETIRAVSPNSWIIRYFTDAPWPMKDFDCVATMVFSDDTNEKTALFRLMASPDEYQNMDMQRAEIYETTYTFNELDSDTVSITISTKMSPPINVPQWMIKMGIVDSAAGTIQRLATLLEEKL